MSRAISGYQVRETAYRTYEVVALLGMGWVSTVRLDNADPRFLYCETHARNACDHTEAALRYEALYAPAHLPPEPPKYVSGDPGDCTP